MSEQINIVMWKQLRDEVFEQLGNINTVEQTENIVKTLDYIDTQIERARIENEDPIYFIEQRIAKINNISISDYPKMVGAMSARILELENACTVIADSLMQNPCDRVRVIVAAERLAEVARK